MDESGLKTQIRNKTFSSVYLFYGEESYLKQLYINRIIDKTVNESFKSFNLHILDGKEATLDMIAECCEALPMMGEYSVTLVDDMALNKLGSTENKKLFELIGDLPETTILIFRQDTAQVNPKEKSWAEIIKLVSANGSCVNLSKKSAAELTKILVAGAQKRDCTMKPDTARYLVSVVGDDMTSLLNELDKVCAFAGGRMITQKDIDAVAVRSLEATTFSLSKALVAGSFDKAYEMLDTLFFRKTEPTLIMGALISAYVDMYRAKVALINGQSATAPAESFNYKNKEFRLTNGARNASKLSVDQLRNALELLSETDEKLKTGVDASGARLAIEQLMVRLMLI
ncbi:MAG: DNA polymerase III subunit delta [Acutalibacteraceae bacterium]